jgi:hypothetical protein
MIRGQFHREPRLFLSVRFFSSHWDAKNGSKKRFDEDFTNANRCWAPRLPSRGLSFEKMAAAS